MGRAGGDNGGDLVPPPTGEQRSMSVRGAAFLGVGSMVGAGIFALLGQAGAVAGSAVWISFLIAGSVAALQATRSPRWVRGTRRRAVWSPSC